MRNDSNSIHAGKVSGGIQLVAPAFAFGTKLRVLHTHCQKESFSICNGSCSHVRGGTYIEFLRSLM